MSTGSMLLEMLQQTYPHIPYDRLKDLQQIGATSEQYERSDAAYKRETDERLKSYLLVDEFTNGDPYHQEGPSSIRVALIGTTGSGKSATGNTLLGGKLFTEGAGAQTETIEEEIITSVTDSYLTVVDTPGSWQLPRIIPDKRIDLYGIVINLASPRFGEKELRILQNLKDYNNILQSGRCFLLLNHASDALRGTRLTEYMNEINGDPLYRLISNNMQNWHVIAINNTCGTAYESKKQHERIGKIIKKTYARANFQPSGDFKFVLLIVIFGIAALIALIAIVST